MEEPCDRVKYLMKIGGFKNLDEYGAWLREPLDDWDEPDWGEAALREVGCIEEGEDNDPAILAAMDSYEDAYLQEKEDRLIRTHGLKVAEE